MSFRGAVELLLELGTRPDPVDALKRCRPAKGLRLMDTGLTRGWRGVGLTRKEGLRWAVGEGAAEVASAAAAFLTLRFLAKPELFGEYCHCMHITPVDDHECERQQVGKWVWNALY